MATATVEHIYTWTGSGNQANFAKTINLSTINGISFTATDAVFFLETTIVYHSDSNALTFAESYRKGWCFHKIGAGNLINNSTFTRQGVFSNTADYATHNPSGPYLPEPIAYTCSGMNTTITFTESSFATNIYFRAICKVIAYKAS